MSPFLAWGDFHARSRFARSTIPEEKWGTTRSLSLSRKFAEDALGSKTPLVTQIAPTDLGLVRSLPGDRPPRLRVGGHRFFRFESLNSEFFMLL